MSQISIWLLGLLWILSRSWMSLSRSDCTEQSVHKQLAQHSKEKIRIIGMSVNVAVCCCQSTTVMMYLKQHASWPLWTYVKIEDGLKKEDNRRNEDDPRNWDDHSLRKSKKPKTTSKRKTTRKIKTNSSRLPAANDWQWCTISNSMKHGQIWKWR